MTRSDINKQVHARLTRMLAHRDEPTYTREEWDTHVRTAIDVHGSRTKAAARAARDAILRERSAATQEAFDLLAEFATQEPLDDATRIFAQVA